MWEDMRLMGDDGWLEAAIQGNTLMMVTDGLYTMQVLCPNMISCAFILECSQGHGRLMGAFSEQKIVACSYQEELLGLMVIHLILLSFNRIAPTLTVPVHINSDCLGALDKIKNLRLHHIPLKCQDSDVQKSACYIAAYYPSNVCSPTSPLINMIVHNGKTSHAWRV
jgi:hypothetical protein